MANASARMNCDQSSMNAEPSHNQAGLVCRFDKPSGVGPSPQVSVLPSRPASVIARSAPREQSLSDPYSMMLLPSGMVGSTFLAFLYEPSTVLSHSYCTPWALPITVVCGLS